MLTALWDAIAGKDETALHRALPQHQAAKGKNLLGLAREHLARRVTEKLAGGRFELIAPPDEGPSQFTIRHRPARLIDAIWQQFAGEIAGMMTRRPLPGSQVRPMVPRSTGEAIASSAPTPARCALGGTVRLDRPSTLADFLAERDGIPIESGMRCIDS